ncbi:MAG: putative transposase [Patescibacteria group bacterium]
MNFAGKQMELPLPDSPPFNTIVINGRCTLRREGILRVVCVAGLPMYHWKEGDWMAEAHAMVSLVLCGYADQNEVARAFGCSTRTLRRHQHRYETGGMSSLGRASGRPQGTRVESNPWVQTATGLKRNGISVCAIAQRLNVSVRSVYRWLSRLDKSVLPSPDALPETETHTTSDTSPDSAVNVSVVNENIQGWSLDTDPTNRQIDRLFARVGLLDDAAPMFVPGKRIPRAGVLLAVPALVQSGVFSVAEEVYGRIGPAFYGLRTTILAMLLMALLRIKRPEGLKEHAPMEVGRLLGLDRAPEVKTLRRKISRLAVVGKAELFGQKLAKLRIAKRGRMVGFLYVDGHVCIYHGWRRISKAYATRLRLALPATTDYWVNDLRGDPIFVVTAEVNEGLIAMLPDILKEIRLLVGKRRVTIVFDRGGWSPKLFLKIIRSGFDILTYRKGRWKEIPHARFETCTKRIEGRKVSYELNDKNIRLLKGRLRLRQITRLCPDGHQTPIVTSRLDLPAMVLAYRMFERWRQENFLKYLREEYALDALVDYKSEPEDPQRLVPNPESRKTKKELTALRAKLKGMQAIYGRAAIDNKEGKRPTIRGFKIAYGELRGQIRELQKQIEILQSRYNQMPKRIEVKDLAGEPMVRLSGERKHLTNCIKMVAYQAESDLLALVRPHYARADQEGRTLITSALQCPADLEIGKDKLRVTLMSLSSKHRSKVIAAICETLNRMEVCFPGTKLQMCFGVHQGVS